MDDRRLKRRMRSKSRLSTVSHHSSFSRRSTCVLNRRAGAGCSSSKVTSIPPRIKPRSERKSINANVNEGPKKRTANRSQKISRVQAFRTRLAQALLDDEVMYVPTLLLNEYSIAPANCVHAGLAGRASDILSYTS